MTGCGGAPPQASMHRRLSIEYRAELVVVMTGCAEARSQKFAHVFQ